MKNSLSAHLTPSLALSHLLSLNHSSTESFYHILIFSFYLPFRSMGISSTGTRAFVFDYGGTLLHKEKVCRQLVEEREKGI